MKSKRTITIETWRRTTVCRPQGAIICWCERCDAESEMISPDVAARVLNVTPRELYRQVESHAIHFIETTGGALLICGSSLSDHSKPGGQDGI